MHLEYPYLKHLLKVGLAECEHVHVSDSSHGGLHGGVVDEALLAEVAASCSSYLCYQPRTQAPPTPKEVEGNDLEVADCLALGIKTMEFDEDLVVGVGRGNMI